MPLQGEYLGMELFVPDEGVEHKKFFEYCGRGDFRLQRWKSNGLLSYPPSTGNPWDGTTEHDWESVEAKGNVMSYVEVPHAIIPALREHSPYLVLLVELDVQRGEPSEHEALRVIGNLVTPDGDLAPPDLVDRVGIGSRVRMVFRRVGEGFALPQWTLDETADQPKPWRYVEGSGP
ncbi:OB-fold domain-containing protein [Myxococcota bacterium]|nr:OB-fold domain-containing protein [Myxococcota bacterium]